WTFSVLFFFQAEDGIRDFHVTGVQTCALPIFVAGHALALLAFSRPPLKWPIGIHEKRAEKASGAVLEWPATRTAALTMPASPVRSEERRVGKDGRSRGV